MTFSDSFSEVGGGRLADFPSEMLGTFPILIVWDSKAKHGIEDSWMIQAVTGVECCYCSFAMLQTY